MLVQAPLLLPCPVGAAVPLHPAAPTTAGEAGEPGVAAGPVTAAGGEAPLPALVVDATTGLLSADPLIQLIAVHFSCKQRRKEHVDRESMLQCCSSGSG